MPIGIPLAGVGNTKLTPEGGLAVRIINNTTDN